MTGVVEEQIIAMATQAGEDLPENIKNAPELLSGLALFYNAFHALSTSRQTAFGIGYIPWGAIREYCDTYEIDGEQRDDMFFFVSELDSVYRDHFEKHAIGTKTETGGSTRPGSRPKRGRNGRKK